MAFMNQSGQHMTSLNIEIIIFSKDVCWDYSSEITAIVLAIQSALYFKHSFRIGITEIGVMGTSIM